MSTVAWLIVGWLGLNALVFVLALLGRGDDRGDAYDLLDRP